MEGKKHLFFLVHGLFGKESHMESLRRELERELPSETCVVYSSKHNELFKTFEGVEMGALRIYEELLQYVIDVPVTHISIIGYSMGGIYVRYLVGLLLRHPTFFRDITPVSFVTFATPHLGATLWKRGLWTRCLNGIARVLLGPSGVDLMSRGPNGVLDRLAKPSSPYMQALAKFPNLILFCNAKGDRSVRFWTSFLTDKHPFMRHHRQQLDLVFFKCDGEIGRRKPYLVDMNNTEIKDKPLPIPEKPKVLEINLAFVILPIFVVVMLAVSSYSWFKYILYRPILKWRCKRIARRFESRALEIGHAHSDTSEDSSSTKNPIYSIEDTLHLAAEDLPPDDEESSGEEIPTGNRRISGLPKPLTGPSPLVESSARIVGFTESMTARLNSLNALPWKKYVAYLDHYRTHANIIDRMEESDTQGRELLAFFAKQVVV